MIAITTKSSTNVKPRLRVKNKERTSFFDAATRKRFIETAFPIRTVRRARNDDRASNKERSDLFEQGNVPDRPLVLRKRNDVRRRPNASQDAGRSSDLRNAFSAFSTLRSQRQWLAIRTKEIESTLEKVKRIKTLVFRLRRRGPFRIQTEFPVTPSFSAREKRRAARVLKKFAFCRSFDKTRFQYILEYGRVKSRIDAPTSYLQLVASLLIDLKYADFESRVISKSADSEVERTTPARAIRSRAICASNASREERQSATK